MNILMLPNPILGGGTVKDPSSIGDYFFPVKPIYVDAQAFKDYANAYVTWDEFIDLLESDTELNIQDYHDDFYTMTNEVLYNPEDIDKLNNRTISSVDILINKSAQDIQEVRLTYYPWQEFIVRDRPINGNTITVAYADVG